MDDFLQEKLGNQMVSAYSNVGKNLLIELLENSKAYTLKQKNEISLNGKVAKAEKKYRIGIRLNSKC